MPDADTGSTDDPEMTAITLKLPQAFLDDIDATWREEDFPSRSEFIRWALRDTVEHPSFSRRGWRDIAVSEHQRRTGEGETYSSKEIRSLLEESADDGE